jgi:hypothetical protein
MRGGWWMTFAGSERKEPSADKGHKKIMLISVLAGQRLGVMQVEDQIWQVSFMDYDLGYFDMDSCRLVPGPNPFGPRVLTM